MTSVSKVKALAFVALIAGVGVALYAPVKRLAANYQEKRDCPGGFRVWDGTQSQKPAWVCQSATLALGEVGGPSIEEEAFLSRYKPAPLATQAQTSSPAKPIAGNAGSDLEN
ncbi:MAG: hypothetical protein RL145_2303 [Pseudomonadota bacterium]|jgi:hypothetical protein